MTTPVFKAKRENARFVLEDGRKIRMLTYLDRAVAATYQTASEFVMIRPSGRPRGQEYPYDVYPIPRELAWGRLCPEMPEIVRWYRNGRRVGVIEK